MYKKLLAVSTVLMSANTVLADDYQFEVGGSYTNVSDDNDTDTDFTSITGKYYLSQVDTTGLPLAEAAFLQRSSSIQALLADSENATAVALGGSFFVPGDMFYVGANVIRTSYDNNVVEDDSTYNITAGITPIEGLLLTTSYNEDVDYDANISAKYVKTLSGGRAINLIGAYQDVEGGFLTAGGDYYFNSRTSLGVLTSNSDDDTTWQIRGKHFVTDALFVGGAYTDSDSASALTLEAGMRF
ncbi:MAG: hypothetical protein ACI93R_001869 [Flavobacteriales bacterium]|jgi:hypothetical protein